jgi:hypothetical protein
MPEELKPSCQNCIHVLVCKHWYGICRVLTEGKDVLRYTPEKARYLGEAMASGCIAWNRREGEHAAH